jgi:hypothetical protein
MELGDKIRTIIEENCEDYFLGKSDLFISDQIDTKKMCITNWYLSQSYSNRNYIITQPQNKN